MMHATKLEPDVRRFLGVVNAVRDAGAAAASFDAPAWCSAIARIVPSGDWMLPHSCSGTAASWNWSHRQTLARQAAQWSAPSWTAAARVVLQPASR